MNDQAMREKKIREAANDLHAAFFVMLRDWKDGDFDLPPLARIHMESMEGKASELGKLLFRQNEAAIECPECRKTSSAEGQRASCPEGSDDGDALAIPPSAGVSEPNVPSVP